MARQSEEATRIEDALRPVVSEAGLHLEEVTVGHAGRSTVVRVTVDLPDGPGGVGSDALTTVSRAISGVLDDVDLVQGAYTLEVSTPGAERALSEPRHFRRAQGRLVELTTGGEKITGRLVDAVGDTITLEIDDARREIPLRQIDSARVRVELNQPNGK